MRNWLITLRKQRHLTQDDVASKAFIDRAYYGQIENGNRNPSLNVALKISEILQFSPSLFYLDQSDPFTLALKDTPITICHCNRSLQITWIFNPHLDFAEEDMLGKRLDEVNNQIGIQKYLELCEYVIEREQPTRAQFVWVLSNGERLMDIIIKPLVNTNNEVIGIISIHTDITEALEDKH